MKFSISLSLAVLCMLVAWLPKATAQHMDPTGDPGNPASDYFIWSERETGIWISADALLWRRNDSSKQGLIIGGPESIQTGNGSFNNEGGFRLGVGWLVDPNYEVEAVWTQFGGWNDSGAGVLTRGISFDGGEASPIVDPLPGPGNFVNTTTFFRPLFDAATDSLGGPPNPDDETTEYEFLRPGSSYTLQRTSEMSDGQLNFKTRRTQGRRFSLGLGYRHISLSEAAMAGVTGTFDAFDVDGDETITNGPNDELSHDALVAHGLQLLSGTGGFNDPSVLGIGDFNMLWTGSSSNQLNGLQGVLDGTIIERGRFTLDGNLRAGLFWNRARGRIAERFSQVGGSTYGHSFADETDTAAFAANAGLSGAFRLAEQLLFRAGYEVMYVNNVGMAPSQQQGLVYNGLGNASYSVQTGDSIILHGLRLGVEYQW